MKKIYDATGELKRAIISVENELKCFDRARYNKNQIGIQDLILVGRTNNFPFDSSIDIHWSLNGLLSRNDIDYTKLGEFIIVEPFEEHVNNSSLTNIGAVDTWFKEKINLSKKATILMSTKKYDEMAKDSKFEQKIKNKDVRLYEGEADLAVKMLFDDKNYFYIDIAEDGYICNQDINLDAKEYISILLSLQEKIADEKNITYGEVSRHLFDVDVKSTAQTIENIEEEKNVNEYEKENVDLEYKMISGLTDEVEGDIELGDNLYASIDIGKRRKNQEDAVLLIKDKQIPEFKMMVVSDGMGGWSSRRNCKRYNSERIKKVV